MEETPNFSQRLVKDVVFLLSKSSEPLNSLKAGPGLGEPPTHSHGRGRAPSTRVGEGLRAGPSHREDLAKVPGHHLPGPPEENSHFFLTPQFFCFKPEGQVMKNDMS